MFTSRAALSYSGYEVQVEAINGTRVSPARWPDKANSERPQPCRATSMERASKLTPQRSREVVYWPGFPP